LNTGEAAAEVGWHVRLGEQAGGDAGAAHAGDLFDGGGGEAALAGQLLDGVCRMEQAGGAEGLAAEVGVRGGGLHPCVRQGVGECIVVVWEGGWGWGDHWGA
jgi:hypothetical protein